MEVWSAAALGLVENRSKREADFRSVEEELELVGCKSVSDLLGIFRDSAKFVRVFGLSVSTKRGSHDSLSIRGLGSMIALIMRETKEQGPKRSF